MTTATQGFVPEPSKAIRWSFMSLVMWRRLASMVEDRAIDSIPRGVLAEAREFFQQVRRFIQGEASASSMPFTTLDDYEVCSFVLQVLGVYSPHCGDSASDMANAADREKDKLLRFASFLDRFSELKELSEEDLETASDLAMFFAGLHQFG